MILLLCVTVSSGRSNSKVMPGKVAMCDGRRSPGSGIALDLARSSPPCLFSGLLWEAFMGFISSCWWHGALCLSEKSPERKHTLHG
ncbi:hypothetical protein INR49_020791 [Caranx melampygus]|nr:hypothetical protein INR49_020791 [Caranx melampygus]